MDNPGGNEGLSKAVSFLRKMLGDENKEIIPTIPTTGYGFHGEILEEVVEHAKKVVEEPKLSLPTEKDSLCCHCKRLYRYLFRYPVFYQCKSQGTMTGKLTRERLKELLKIDQYNRQKN